MWKSLRLVTALLILAISVPTLVVLAKKGCDVGGVCELGDRSYGVRSPWTSGPHPVVVFLPGSFLPGETAAQMPELYGATDDKGYILVVPTGVDVTYENGRQGPGWRWFGEGFEADRMFIEEVLADLASRHKIDRSRILITGHSSGGVFSLYLACTGRAQTEYFATSAAAFVKGRPTGCNATTPPFWLYHDHGARDYVVPLAGSAGTAPWQAAADWTEGLAETQGCTDQRETETEDGATVTYSECRGGGELVLNTHQGSHQLDGAWLRDALDWFEAVQAERAGS